MRYLTELQRERIMEWLGIDYGDDGAEKADDAIVKLTDAAGRPIATLNAEWLKSLVVDTPADAGMPTVDEARTILSEDVPHHLHHVSCPRRRDPVSPCYCEQGLEIARLLNDPSTLALMRSRLPGTIPTPRDDPHVLAFAERERCAQIADAEAAQYPDNFAAAVKTLSDAGAGEAIGSASTARRIAAKIRALPGNEQTERPHA